MKVQATLKMLFLCLFGMTAAAENARAQATFQVAGAASTVIATGHAELAGEVTLTVVSGTTVAGRVDIVYPVALANDTSSGVSIVATGGLASATVTSAAGAGIVIVNIPAGATAGSTVSVRGVRFSIVANNISTMSATISSTGNFITAGQGVVPVINSATNGFTLQTSTSPTVTIANGAIVTPPSDFTIIEAFAASFRDAVGLLGQTTPTQIIFQVTGLPDNVTLTFPATVTGDSGAQLMTDTGTPVDVTNQTSNRVTYLFSGVATSPEVIETFVVTPTVALGVSPGSGTAFVQAALGPIGINIPNADFPSTDRPRFAQNFLPPLNSIPGAVLSQTFPIFSFETDRSLAISNLGTGGAVLSFSASRSDGTTTASTLNPILARRETRVFSLGQLFAGIGTSTITSIRVDSLNNRLLGTSFGVAPGGRTSGTPMNDLQRFVLPMNLTSPARDAMIVIANSASTPADLSITLRTAGGQTIATVTRNLAAAVVIREPLLTLFNLPATAVPANSYIDGVSPSAVKVTLFANPAGPVEEIPGLGLRSTKKYRHPYFAVKDGYGTVVSLVNASGFPITVTATPLQMNGATFPGITASVRQLGPLERLDLDVATFFGGTALVIGSLNLDFERADVINPFSTPLVAGLVRTSTASSSAIVSLFANPITEFFVGPATENNAFYTGIAVANESGVSVDVTIEVFLPGGTLLGAGTVAVGPLAVQARLIRDVVPAALGMQDGLVRVTSANPVNAVVFRGSLTNGELLSLMPQQ
jgi:hypothetical protein